ncbi:MAG: aminopeptidase P family N-terminal domain-containing protein, partial [Hyphomicrobiales bacterium]|nr:aminopeptidase P family N-terminal domain-containing protein [Hyphomicrobiales bacterium]
MEEARYTPKERHVYGEHNAYVLTGDPGNPAHREWADVGLAAPDVEAMRDYRLERLRAELRKRDFAGAILYDPLNVRYATDCSNMQVWCMHNAVRYAYVATEGPVVMFDFHGCLHLSDGFSRITESRKAVSWYYFGAGPHERERAGVWAAELAQLVRETGGGNTRIAVDRCDPMGIEALAANGIEAYVSMEFAEEARKI